MSGNPVVTEWAGRERVGMRDRLMRWARRYVNAHCINVLAYHSVSPADSPFTTGLPLRHSPGEFAAHLAYLRRHYRPTSLRRVVSALEEGRPTDRAVVLTLDDGFRDALTHAYPLAREHRIPITVFLVTSVVGNSDLMWRHKLGWLIAHGRGGRVLEALRSEISRRGAHVDPARFGPSATASQLYELARRAYRPDLVPPLLDELLAECGWSGPRLAEQHRPYLEPADLAAVDPELVEFGCHTHTHPMLSALSPAEQLDEMTRARELILAWTRRMPLAVAYPFGLRDSYDAHSIEAAQRCGCRAALDMRRRINVGTVSPFDISRKPAPRGDQAAFERAVEDLGGPAQRPAAAHPSEHLMLTRRMYRGVPARISPLSLRPADEQAGPTARPAPSLVAAPAATAGKSLEGAA